MKSIFLHVKIQSGDKGEVFGKFISSFGTTVKFVQLRVKINRKETGKLHVLSRKQGSQFFTELNRVFPKLCNLIWLIESI